MKRRDVFKNLLIGGAFTTMSFSTRAQTQGKPKKYKAISDNPFYESASPDNVFPKVFQVGKTSKLRLVFDNLPSDFSIICTDNNGFDLRGNQYFPEYRTIFKDGITGYEMQPTDFSKKVNLIPFTREGGVVFIEVTFPKEGRYCFAIRAGHKNKTIARAWVYALESDLFALRPYRGDIHMHSSVSDGKNTNTEMAITGLSVGFDFMAISDHRHREGSTDLIENLKDVPISMSLFPAEEAHASLLHINNFGSDVSIEEWSVKERADFDARTNRILKTISPELGLSKLDALTLAQSEAVFEKIKECGGLAIFNHPYWNRDGERFYVSDSLRDTLIKRAKFDAFEVVNGAINYDSTDLSIARHSEALADGFFMPIVGCSDAHNVDELGCGVTIALAKSNSLADIKEAIMNLNTVAVDTFGNYERPKFFGKQRVMRYVSFLWKNYFPLHDVLCETQSSALREFLRSGKTRNSRAKLAEISSQTKRLLESLWG